MGTPSGGTRGECSSTAAGCHGAATDNGGWCGAAVAGRQESARKPVVRGRGGKKGVVGRGETHTKGYAVVCARCDSGTGACAGSGIVCSVNEIMAMVAVTRCRHGTMVVQPVKMMEAER